ncbi:MAG: hypothetical protein GYB31_13720 [Bacteroidetes bacterium]|nr:hypothetical protein [Bacteroidota bacterium]
MRKFILGAAFLLFLAFAATSCSPKYGCEMNQDTHSSLENSKGGNSNLFPKHMRRKRN